MAQVNIYKNKRLIDSRKFVRNFAIVGKKHLAWQCYDSVITDNYTTDQTSIDLVQTSIIQINLLKRENVYELSPINHTWQLWIDEQKCLKGFYGEVIITWHKVKLAYLEYEFIFSFFDHEIMIDNVKISLLPKPLLDETQIDLSKWDN